MLCELIWLLLWWFSDFSSHTSIRFTFEVLREITQQRWFRWFAMKFSKDNHVPLRMNCNPSICISPIIRPKLPSVQCFCLYTWIPAKLRTVSLALAVLVLLPCTSKHQHALFNNCSYLYFLYAFSVTQHTRESEHSIVTCQNNKKYHPFLYWHFSKILHFSVTLHACKL